MGKLKDRQTTTIHSTLLRWRKLLPLKFSYVSGYCVKSCSYLSSKQFQSVCHYPALEKHWHEHYLAKDFNGNYYVLPTSEEVRSNGPMI
jgi:hypothetical protein